MNLEETCSILDKNKCSKDGQSSVDENQESGDRIPKSLDKVFMVRENRLTGVGSQAILATHFFVGINSSKGCENTGRTYRTGEKGVV